MTQQQSTDARAEDLRRWELWRANAGRWQAHRSWVVDDAAAALVHRGAGLMLLGLGEPPALARLLADIDPGEVGHVMLTAGTWARVPAAVRRRLGYRLGRSWEWMACRQEPPVQPGEENVAELTGPDRVERAHACLRHGYPERDPHPDDAAVAWWGYHLPAGRPVLAGVVGVVEPPPGAGPSGAGMNLQALGVVPAHRRLGVAAALTGALTRRGLTRGPLVHLGIWSDNDPARRVYTRLGYRTEHHVENLRPSP